MTKNISITKFATMTLLSLACASGCTLEVDGIKGIDDLGSTEESSDGGATPSIGGGSSEGGSSEGGSSEGGSSEGGSPGGGWGSESGGSSTSGSPVVPESGAVYQGGDAILLSGPGIAFVIPEGLYGAGDNYAFDIGLEDWMGLVTIYGLDANRSELEPTLASTLEMAEGEYWVPSGDVQSYEDATVVDYLVEGSADGVTHATITAIYGETGITALLIGMGVESTIEDVMYVSDSVAGTTAFTTPAG